MADIKVDIDMKKTEGELTTVITSIVSVALTLAVDSYIVYSCWNWNASDLYGLKAMTYEQAIALTLFVHTLFKLDRSP